MKIDYKTLTKVALGATAAAVGVEYAQPGLTTVDTELSGLIGALVTWLMSKFTVQKVPSTSSTQ